MRKIELPLGWPTVLHAIVDGPGLWVTPMEIVERNDLAEVYGKRWRAFTTVVDRCRGMLDAGWLTGSADGPNPGVTLSERAAARLGVRVDADGDSWVGFDLRWFPRARCCSSFTREELSVEYIIPDTQPSPLEQLVELEQLEPAPWPARTGPGIGRAWIWHWRHEPCDDCRHVRLPEGFYCLGCGRPWWETL